MKKIFIGILMLLVMLSSVSALITVTRSFSNDNPKAGENLIVYLKYDITGTENLLALEDVDPFYNEPHRFAYGSSDSIPSNIYQYNIKIPSNTAGLYNFKGYFFSSNNDSQSKTIGKQLILGDDELKVDKSIFSMYFMIGLLIISVVVFVIWMLKKR